MRYFSGFCLSNEEELFNFWLEKSDFAVAGFSYGAIKAFEYALNSKERIDRLILLSPAFFNDKDEKFKRLQLLYFDKDKKSYINNFLKNITLGANVDIKNYFKEGSKEELKELLYYKWNRDKLKELKNKDITLEVVLGGQDKIINTKAAKDFFEDFGVIYYIKEANHLLIS